MYVLTICPLFSYVSLSFKGWKILDCEGFYSFPLSLSHVFHFYFVSRDGRLQTVRVGVFKLFPILLTILIVWGLCAILTATGAISEDNAARWV